MSARHVLAHLQDEWDYAAALSAEPMPHARPTEARIAGWIGLLTLICILGIFVAAAL